MSYTILEKSLSGQAFLPLASSISFDSSFASFLPHANPLLLKSALNFHSLYLCYEPLSIYLENEED